jgi:hypothetical protein
MLTFGQEDWMTMRVLRFLGRVSTHGLMMGLLVLATGCGTSIEDLCDDLCECEGCSDAQYDACVREGEAAEEMADQLGCGDEFEDYVDCLGDSFTCDDGDADTEGQCGDMADGCESVQSD